MGKGELQRRRGLARGKNTREGEIWGGSARGGAAWAGKFGHPQRWEEGGDQRHAQVRPGEHLPRGLGTELGFDNFFIFIFYLSRAVRGGANPETPARWIWRALSDGGEPSASGGR